MIIVLHTNFDKMPDSLVNTNFREDVKYHRYIQLSFCDKFLLLLHYNMPCLGKISCWKKKGLFPFNPKPETWRHVISTLGKQSEQMIVGEIDDI